MQDKVVVSDLVKHYGPVKAVDGVSLALREGEVFGLLGPNGAGKSTTVEIIEGLRTPDRGLVRVCGFDPATQPKQVKERLGIQLQATAMPSRIRVREALRLFGSFYPRRRDHEHILQIIGLTEKKDAYYEHLSGGQKQRLALGLALINDPEVVILDEPTTGLDPHARRGIYDIITELERQSKTVLLTTHYIEEAERLCDRVAIIDRGRIIACDTPQALVARSAGMSRIEFRARTPIETASIEGLDSVASCRASSQGLVLWTPSVSGAVTALLKRLERDGNQLDSLRIVPPSLEDVLIEMTGHRIE